MDKNDNQNDRVAYSNLPSEYEDTSLNSIQNQPELTQNLASHLSPYQNQPIPSIYPNQHNPVIYPSLPAYAEHLPPTNNMMVQTYTSYNQQYPTFNAPGVYSAGFVHNQTQVFQSLPAQSDHVMIQPNLPGQIPPQYQNRTSPFEMKNETMNIKVPDCLRDSCFKKVFPRTVPRKPIVTQCPACNNQITTRILTDIGCGLVSSMAGLFLCCPYACWVPLCMQDCYDISHNCPNCGYKISKEKFLCK